MKKAGSKKKVLVALSGGIDSAVSAYLLLKSGYQVEAAFMKNWSSTAGLKVSECPWLQDRQDAIRVAAFLRIPLHTLDFEKQYASKVMKYFFNEYKAGRTPNPDVMCNKEIKFKLLYQWAMERGFDYLATGHYAQVGRVESRKLKVESKMQDFTLSTLHFQLIRSADTFKDQTYFIYNIKQKQLPHVLFPIGGMKKTDVRKLAKKIKLPNADKRESMGLCFVGKIRLKDFLEQKLKAKKGEIVLLTTSPQLRRGTPPWQEERNSPSLGKGRWPAKQDGRVIGYHQGLHNYTIGQRQGVNVGEGGPYYVVKKDLAKNILYVTSNPNDPLLETTEVVIHSVNWISEPQGLRASNFAEAMSDEKGVGLSEDAGILALSPIRYTLLARYRHQGELIPVTVEQIKKDQYVIKFKTPQKAIASGQSLVLYTGKLCLGGGVIA